jgi:hypothetical protein
MATKAPPQTSKVPSPEQIEKKLRLSLGLFEAAFEIKRHQLAKRHPGKTEQELNHMTMAMFEKGSK